MTTAITALRSQLDNMSNEIQRVLPEHVTLDRFQRITLTAIQRQPELLETTRKSLFAAVMQCAQDGLQPDGRDAALVKFGKESVYMPMVAGLLKLARNSGDLASLTAHVVYEGDEFDYWIDENGEHIKHKPTITGTQGKAECVYAMARTTSGETIVEVMRVEEVEKVRKASRSGNSGPWKDWWSEMARKTAIRRLFKRLPRSTDMLDRAIRRDDQLYPRMNATTELPESLPSSKQSLEALTGPAPEASETEPEGDTGTGESETEEPTTEQGEVF